MDIVTIVAAKIYEKLQYYFKRSEEQKYLSSIKAHGNNCKIAYPSKIVGGEFVTSGKELYIGANSRIEALSEYSVTGQSFSPNIKFGDGVKIQGACHIGAINDISIGNNVLMGNGVFITDHAHGDSSIEENLKLPNNRKLVSKGKVKISDNVWLCENAIVLPNVIIGSGTIIAANSVVTTDIPANCVAAGAPAKIVKKLFVENNYDEE